MALDVVGAGFGRTGTLTLKTALEQLGFGPCHHMVEVLQHPETAALWEAAAEGQPTNWEEIFAGYRSTVDWPSATFWRQIAEANPKAKVILTEREPEAWFASTQATIFMGDYEDVSTPFTRMIAKVIGDLFDRRMKDKDHVIGVYKRHNETVKRTIPPERLLVYEVSQGWEPLCGFLGVPVPATPMPKTNTTEEFHQKVATMFADLPPGT